MVNNPLMLDTANISDNAVFEAGPNYMFLRTNSVKYPNKHVSILHYQPRKIVSSDQHLCHLPIIQSRSLSRLTLTKLYFPLQVYSYMFPMPLPYV